MAAFGNRVLDEISSLLPEGLESVRLRSGIFRRGDVLGEPGTRLETIYFPVSALISAVIQTDSGDGIGGVMIGNDGVFGGATAFGLETPVFSSLVERAGTCWVMSVSDLRRIVRENYEAAALLFRYQHYLVAQAQQIAACSTRHNVQERFCTYLLRVRDERDEVRFTQEDVAHALGVQRTSISLVAGGLQNEGIIRYRRGQIKIKDSNRLRACACECHSAIEKFKLALFDCAPAIVMHDQPAVVEG